MLVSARELRRFVLLFLAIVVIGGIPWPGVDDASASVYRALVGGVVERQTFENNGKLTLTPASHNDPARLESNSWNTTLWLSSPARPRPLPVTINPRRVTFLPLLLLTATIVASPLSARRKLGCLGLGVGIAWACSVVWLHLMGAYLFQTRINPGFETLPGLERQLLHFLYRGVLAPPASKIIVALSLGIALVYWQLTRERGYTPGKLAEVQK